MKKLDRNWLMLLVGLFLGISIAYLSFELLSQPREVWYIGWECYAWNTTRGFIVTGSGTYVNTTNGTAFFTWEQLGFPRTSCVKYYYVKSKWPINNTPS